MLYPKGDTLSKSWNADIFGFGEVESCNLAKMCIISGAMNECIGTSVCMSMSMVFRKWCTFKSLIYFNI